MNRKFAIPALILIMLASSWALGTRQYLNYGKEKRALMEKARQEAIESLLPLVSRMANDLGENERTGKLAPKTSPNHLFLCRKTSRGVVSVEYGLTPNKSLYRKTGGEKNILAPGILQFWLSPGAEPLSWNLNLTANLKVGGKIEAAIFNFYFAPRMRH